MANRRRWRRMLWRIWREVRLPLGYAAILAVTLWLFLWGLHACSNQGGGFAGEDATIRTGTY